MTRLIQAVFLALIFQHAFCCFSQIQTKPELCNNLQSNPQNSVLADANGFSMEDLITFCHSDSMGDGRNGLCEQLNQLTPHLSTSLANNLTEFCNPQFRGMNQNPRMEIQINARANARWPSCPPYCPEGSSECKVL